MKTGCLYRLTFPNGKSYVGITKHAAERRFAKHAENARCGSQHAIHRAIRKYGAETVMVETLSVADWDYLKALEMSAIAAFGTKIPNGYNMTDGGEGTVGHTHNAETIERMRASHRGVPLSEETKARMSAASNGKPKSVQHRANMSAARRGIKLSECHREKLSIAHTGKTFTAEHRAKLSISQSGRTLSEENRLKLISANTGRRKSADEIARRQATRLANRLSLETNNAEKISA